MLKQFLTAQAGTSLSGETKRLIANCRVDLAPGGHGISELRRRFSTPLHILMAIVGLVLLTACANVANLLLARATERRREMTMRLALGAGRGRLIRQLLTESAVLAAGGGVVAVAISWWGTKLLLGLLAKSGEKLPLHTNPDVRVLVFTAGVSLLAMLLFGLTPALHSTTIDLASSLKGSTTRAGVTVAHVRLDVPELLVIGQLALSVMLLTAGGLLIRSFANLESQDLGFNRQRVLMVQFDARLAGYKPDELALLNRRIEERVSSLPGVLSASLAKNSLLGSDIMGGDIAVEGYTPRPREDMTIQVNLVSPRYFETEGMQLLNGRAFTVKDDGRKPASAVINETMARRFFPGRNPMGRTFAFGSPNEIIGAVKDAKYNSLKGTTPAMAYLLLSHHTPNDLEVRTAGDPMSVAPQVRQALAQIDSRIPILSVTTLARQVDDALAQERLVAGLAGFFGFTSLALASVGLYGILSVFTSRRRQEIGIRLAIGAQPRSVVWLVLRQTMLLLGGGVTLGLTLGVSGNKLIASQLFGVDPHDFMTMALSIGLLLAVGFCSAFIPAKRAAGTDPMVALRYE